MPSDDEPVWVDEAAGPMVRLYAMAGGRTGSDRDLAAVVTAAEATPRALEELNPEHLELLEHCRRPVAVAELAGRMALPVGVVNVLLDDLVARRLVGVTDQDMSRRLEVDVLDAVLRGLQAL